MPKSATICYPVEGTDDKHERVAASDLADFVKAKVSTVRYSSSSEVVREALRLMERVEQRNAEKLAYLRKAWQDGIDSGEPEELDFAALKAEARVKLAGSSLAFWLTAQGFLKRADPEGAN